MRVNYVCHIEVFNQQKLAYFIEYTDELKEQCRPSFFEKEYDPIERARTYLEKSRHGQFPVVYLQWDSYRYNANFGLSLHMLPREIRHTIATEYYIHIDMANAHPVILEWLCKQKNIPCPCLSGSNANRERFREQLKHVYLSLINGGNKAYNKLPTKTAHVKDFKKEMITIPGALCTANKQSFELYKKKREDDKNTFNIQGGFIHRKLEYCENKILIAKYTFFGKPEDSVLCFDGHMF